MAGHPSLIRAGMFKNVFQIAYVTNDLRRAVALFRSEQGVA